MIILSWFIQNQNQYFNQTLKVKHMVYNDK